MIRKTNTARFRSATRFGILITLAAGFFALTPPAFAAGDDDLPQATLNIGKIDFTSPKAIGHLQRRVRHTAFAICNPDWDGKTMMSSDQRKCYNTAMQNGMAQVESKRLYALRQTATPMVAAQVEEHPTH